MTVRDHLKETSFSMQFNSLWQSQKLSWFLGVNIIFRISGARLSEWGIFSCPYYSPEASLASKRCSSKLRHHITLYLTSFRDLEGSGLNGTRTNWGRQMLKEGSQIWSSGPRPFPWWARLLEGEMSPDVMFQVTVRCGCIGINIKN